MRIAAAALLLLTACAGERAGTADPITWYGDVQPVVYRTCANCHSEGSIGPGDFTNYDGFRLLASMARAQLDAGLMPPPASESDCRPYKGAEHLQITDDERLMILDWIDAGLPEGDPADAAPAFEPYFQHLQDPDLVLPLPEEHTLHPNESGNEYRCFVLDYVPDHDFSITAFDPQIGNEAVVHHLILFRDPNHDAGSEYGVAPGTKSFDCMNPIMESDWEPLHAWAPGMPTTVLQDGLGLEIHAGDQLVIQMHYYDPSHEPETDRSAYALKTTTDTVGEVQMYPGALPGFHIPAGDPDYTYTRSFPVGNLPVDLALWGIFPHMHYLGQHYEAKVTHADGTEECAVRGGWDFDHQMAYMFDEPLIIHSGDTVSGSCNWDNSADNPNQLFDPPEPINWGEGTDDEMCVFLMYMSIAPTQN